MYCKVIDGLFDDLFLHEKYQEILETPLVLTNVANRKTYPYGNEGTHRLMGRTIFNRTGFNRVEELYPNSLWYFDMFDAIQEKIENDLYLQGIYINVQYYACDGTTHSDAAKDNDYTILVMSNPKWEKDWGGEFQLMKDFNNPLETYKYVPGRVIILPGAFPHRGLAPTKPYIYRSSIAYRVEIPEGERLTIIN